MNRRAEQLGMKETRYLDPHGNSANRASARDLLRLAWTTMQDENFRAYVQTRRHACTAGGGDDGNAGDDAAREVVWTNTNQLLAIHGYDGVKTGTTSAAGACLVSSGRRGDDHLLLVVLGSTSKDGRYVDSRNLFRWAWRERGHK
jgi:D-alanyl-D-alanine carboxypeptidase (penicillin-binding protein 5/6)